MDALMTQKKEIMKTGFETCPVCCGKRRPKNLTCWNCKKSYDDQAERTKNNGGVVTMNLFQWAYMNANNNVLFLEGELLRTIDEKKQHISLVRKAVKNDLAAKGVAFVDNKDFKELMYKKFIELFGEEKSKKISKIISINPRKIASLKRLIADQEEKMQQSVE